MHPLLLLPLSPLPLHRQSFTICPHVSPLIIASPTPTTEASPPRRPRHHFGATWPANTDHDYKLAGDNLGAPAAMLEAHTDAALYDKYNRVDAEVGRIANAVRDVECNIPGKHSFSVRGVTVTVHEKYKIQKVVGVGAYGVVMAAENTHTGHKVALKKIAGVFEDLTDAKRILREIRLMQALDHENVLPLCDMEAPESLEEFHDVYMASPLFDKDLSKIIDSKVALTDEHNRFFIYQILCALKYLHSANVMHRDLKPANLLAKETCELAVCDFGLARYVEDRNEQELQAMTEYVVTRWYRAPELVLTHEYTNAVDLWAVGCIMGDLLGRKVMFPGKDFKHQVETICEVLGKPKEGEYNHVTSQRARKFLERLPETDGIPLETLFPEAPMEALDLLRKLLRFNPEDRLTAEEALRHEYMADFHDEEYERTADGVIDMSMIEPKARDGGELTTEEVKAQMVMEIYKFRPDAPIFAAHPELIPRESK